VVTRGVGDWDGLRWAAGKCGQWKAQRWTGRRALAGQSNPRRCRTGETHSGWV